MNPTEARKKIVQTYLQTGNLCGCGRRKIVRVRWRECHRTEVRGFFYGMRNITNASKVRSSDWRSTRRRTI